MDVLQQISHVGSVQSVALSPDGRQAAVAVGKDAWIRGKSRAQGQQSIFVYDHADGRLNEHKVHTLPNLPAGQKTTKLPYRFQQTKIAFLDNSTIAAARLLTDANFQDRVQVLVMDLKTGQSRARLLDDEIPNFVTGVIAASARHFFVGIQLDVICLNAATLAEVCRTGELDPDGLPLNEDVIGDESIAPGGFAYHPDKQLLYTAPGYYNGGVIYCYKFDSRKRRLQRQWRREVVDNRPSRKDAELLSIRSAAVNPDGGGATALFVFEGLCFDFWGHPISDAEAARDKAVQKMKDRRRVPMPKHVRLAWLGVFGESTDEWIEVVSELDRDFEVVGGHFFYGEGKPIQIGYSTCSRDPWSTQPVYLDAHRVLLATPTGFLQVIDIRSGTATVAFDLRTAIDRLGATNAPQITSLAFAPQSGMLLVGIDNGTLVALQVDSATNDQPRQTTVTPRKTKVRIPKPKPTAKPSVVTDSVGYSISPVGSRDSVSITPDGRLASCGSHVWDVARQWNVAVLPSFCDSTILTRDGRKVFSGDGSGTVSLWDVANCRPIWSVSNRWNSVRHIAISPDERHAASVHNDCKVRIWDLEKGEQVALLAGHKAYVEAVAFSPDSTQLVTASWDKTLRVWNVATGKPRFTLRGHTDEVLSVVWTPDGRFIISGSEDKTLRVWDVAKRSCDRVLKGHGKAVLCVALIPDGKTLVSSSGDGTLRVWNVDRGSRSLRNLDCLGRHVISLAVADHSLAIGVLRDTGTYHGVHMWNVTTGESLGRVGQWRQGHHVLTADGRLLCKMTNDKVYLGTVESEGCEPVETTLIDHTCSIWDVIQRSQIAVLPFTSAGLYEFKKQGWGLSENGRLAAFHSYDHDGPWIAVWKTRGRSGRRFLRGPFAYVNCLAVSADARFIITGHQDKLCHFWRTDRTRCQATLSGHTKEVTRVALSADGSRAISASEDETVRVWDTTRGKCVRVFEQHNRSIQTITLSRDGALAASGSEDGVVYVWNTTTGQCLQELMSPVNEPVTIVLFNSAATRLATAHCSCHRVWDLATGEALVQYENEGYSVASMAFREEEGVLLTVHEAVVRRWNLPF